jgi:SAM-dependent methyltransferase
MEKLRIPSYPVDDSITGVAVKQFRRWGWKATDKYWLHNYTKLYDNHCGHLRDTASKILEIGVKLGGSLRLWQEAFPKATVYGVDVDIKPADLAKDVERIVLLQGSQIDEKFNKESVIPKGPFDIIVDDASHRAEHQRKGFQLLWDSVKKGGFYIIEDLYYRNYYMSKDHSMMKTLSDLIDELNQKCEIAEMHFYYNICFIRKR